MKSARLTDLEMNFPLYPAVLTMYFFPKGPLLRGLDGRLIPTLCISAGN